MISFTCGLISIFSHLVMWILPIPFISYLIFTVPLYLGFLITFLSPIFLPPIGLVAAYRSIWKKKKKGFFIYFGIVLNISAFLMEVIYITIILGQGAGI